MELLWNNRKLNYKCNNVSKFHKKFKKIFSEIIMRKYFKFNGKIYFLLLIVFLMTLSSCILFGRADDDDDDGEDYEGGPTISIIYEGMNNVWDPGVWNVNIEDYDEGLEWVIIEIDGNMYIRDLDLDEMESVSYQNIPVPAIVGTHVITVTASNEDDFGDDDEEDDEEGTAIKEHSVTLIPYDITPPVIIIDYVGESNMDDPGVWNVYIEDLESGIDTVIILVNGIIIIEEQLGGITSHSFNDITVPAVIDIHTIMVIATDSLGNESQVSQDKTIVPGSVPGPGPIIVI